MKNWICAVADAESVYFSAVAVPILTPLRT